MNAESSRRSIRRQPKSSRPRLKYRLRSLSRHQERAVSQSTRAILQTNKESAIRSASSYLEPLRPRLPPEGTLRPSRPPLERSQSELDTRNAGPPSTRTTIGAPDVASQDQHGGPLKKNFSFTDGWDSQKDSLRGIGKYRMSVNADPEHQLNYLHRTMSDLTNQMVQHLGDFNISGADPSVWRQYQKSRTESMTSSASSQSSNSQLSPRECFDPKRRVNVTRGFTPSLISSTSSSAGDDQSSHYRKDSTLSMTSVSSDGESRHRRRKSRQPSLPVSDNSAGSPLTTITENPDADKSQQKIARPCKFDIAANTDSAVESGDEDDDGTWMPEVQAVGKPSHLTKQIERDKKAPTDGQQLARPQTRHGDRPKTRYPTKAAVDRSRTVKHQARHVVRRAYSPKRTKSKRVAVEAPKARDTEVDDLTSSTSEDVTFCDTSVPNPPPNTPASPTSIEDAVENPTDLSKYMEIVRSKHSSRAQPAKSKENEDDNSSINSSSTAKTLVPIKNKILEALPIHRRQRSATAFRVPPTTCQPPIKAEGSRPEQSQATAH